MLLSFFKKADHKLDDLKEGLLDLHAASQKKLHETHPHINKILKKHNIDPEKVRQAAPRVLVASALLGAFLAYPHLFGKPTPTEEPKTETAAHVAVAKKPAHLDQKASVEAKKDGSSSNATSQPSSGSNNQNENKDKEKGKDEVEEKTEKSQGHIYGRSAQAPPKEHVLHDLGLHKGEDNNPNNPEKGPHPEKLNIVHKEDK